MKHRLRHALYVLAWALFGNSHHNPPTHGHHFTGLR
jgi:hypothetical protein